MTPSRRAVAVISLMAIILTFAIGIVFNDESSGPEAGGGRETHALGNVTADAGTYPPVVQGSTVWFNGSGSHSNVTITNYTWTFDDGGPKTLYGVNPDYAFMNASIYIVTLTVTDADLNTSSSQTTITVKKDTIPPVIKLLNRTIAPGASEVIALDASRCTDNGKIVNYTWFLFSEERFLYGMKVNYTFEKAGKYLVSLTIRDAGGNNASAQMIIDIQREPTIIEKNWVAFFLVLPLLIVLTYALAAKLRRDKRLVTPTDVEKLRLAAKNSLSVSRRFMKSLGGMIGLAILVVFVIMAILAPLLASKYNTESLPANAPKWGDYNPSYAKPSSHFPFGTDYYGRDVYTLTVWGSRASLTVGFLASFISIVLGTVVGLSAGYFGKLSDEVLMRFTDFFLVIPWFPLMIVFASLLGKSFTNIIIVIGITSWPSTARIVRSSVLSIKEKTFVERAIAVGSGSGRIIWRHILPNVFPLIFANTILLVANSIFSESFLDFFGLGPTNVISWGLVLEWAYEYGAFSSFAWWNIFFPGACIVLLIMAFYLIGDSLDEVMNPKLRKR